MEEIDEKLLKEIEEKNKEIFFYGAKLATFCVFRSLREANVINFIDEEINKIWEEVIKKCIERNLRESGLIK